jgi:threonylcarbamoyladenosine tRNA methylthiotransferase MtaB
VAESSDDQRTVFVERQPKVALMGLGCRVNQSDLDALASGLPSPFVLAQPGEAADFVVVNTCTVTNDADSASRQAIRRAVREHPGARIIAAGCYAGVFPEVIAGIPGVTAVVGSRDQSSLPELLRRLDAGEDPETALEQAAAGAPDWPPAPLDLVDHTRGFLKLQDGCDARCSYCIIPSARGPSRSLGFDDALSRLATMGQRHPEVVLAGVHLGQYGSDLEPRRSLTELVRMAVRQGVAKRLRFSSIEPLEFPFTLLQGETAPFICEHFHIPLQSGSSKILAAMRRPYRVAEYRRLVERIAAAVPGVCVGADVITGFPGETDEDHRETVHLIEALPLAYLHIFPFSPRRGTPAAEMADQIPGAVARERARELQALSDRRWRTFVAGQAGHVLEVVVERIEGGLARGTSRQWLTVRWPARRDQRGQVVKVRVEASDGSECFGVHAGVFSSRLLP